MNVLKRGGRGQASGGGAAVLVLILTILIILYILFLPPTERQAVLDDRTGVERPGSGAFPGNRTLLLEHPGRLDFIDQRDIEHHLPAVNLYTTTSAQLLKSIKSLYVKNGWFDEIRSNFTFPVEDIENTRNALLSFNVLEGKGKLMVTVNGEAIFVGALQQFNPEPITIPKDVLQPSNRVEFSVDPVGWKFWSTNEYQLQDIKITADITDKSTQEARSVFLVTTTEKDNINRVFVKFFPDCVPGTVGVLEIFLNNHNIFQAVPDCGILRPIEVSPHFLIQGENSLSFRTNRGVYLIDQIAVKSELKELTFPSYYFELDESAYNAILSGFNVVLYLDFGDDVTFKKGQVFVNGHVMNINTKDKQWFGVLNLFVDKGTNVIEIIPRSTMDIVNLEVVME